MSSSPAIEVNGLGKRYRVRPPGTGGLRRQSREDFWALRDITFEVTPGESLGLIGRNGAGKSTLLKILARITRPTEGSARLVGRVASLLEVGTGFHPELTGRDNIYLNGTIMGMRRREVAARFDEIVDFAQIARFLDTPVKHYSSGMYVRLAFSVAAHLQCQILLVDEVLAVGDADFQRRSLGKMDELTTQGRTVVFVSHSMESVQRLCNSAVLVEDGALVHHGPVGEVVSRYLGHRQANPGVAWLGDGAPGDDSVRVRGLELLDRRGDSRSEFDVRDAITIKISYEVLATSDAGDRVLPTTGVILRNEAGVELFASNDRQGERPAAGGAGRYAASCTIPGNFLAEGAHLITVLVHSSIAVHARLDDAVSFEVRDPGGPGTVRGDFAATWAGVVRPWLDWRVAPAGTGTQP